MKEFELFHIALPENYIINVRIAATNNQLPNNITLQELYTWLGCNFFVSCIERVSDEEDWKSTKSISDEVDAHVRLIPYMAKAHIYKFQQW